MPGRLRTRDNFSDKAQGCCNKCCEAVCRISPWNQMLCVGGIVVLVIGLVIWLAGAFLASTAGTPSGNHICTAETRVVNNATVLNPSEVIIPVIGENVYIWYLKSTGILVLIALFATCCCCGAFFGCCCVDFGFYPKCCSLVVFILVAVAMTIFFIWLGAGSYLISTFAISKAINGVCRNIFVYVVLMYIYVGGFLILILASIIWKLHAVATGDNTPYTKIAKAVKV